MKQTIYVDVLLAVNLFVNYFLLLSVSRFLRLEVPRKRMIMGAVAGAFSSFVILIPEISPILSVLFKLAVSAAIVAVAFPIGSFPMFFRIWACFYLMNFAFAGIMMALWYFFQPSGMILKNSVVYFNISPLLLLVMTVICYFAIRGLNWMAGKRGHAGDFCLVTIRNNGCEIQVPARIDTGNSLKEPFSQFPVVVAEYDCIKTILPDEIQASWEKNQFLPLEGSRIRIIPFHALGGGGLLPAFRPERIVVKWPEGSTELSAVYVAVCKIKLSETFHALLNPQILTEGRQIDKGGKKLEKGNRSNIR